MKTNKHLEKNILGTQNPKTNRRKKAEKHNRKGKQNKTNRGKNIKPHEG